MAKETAFSIRLFQLGVKLILKKTQIAGSNENFIKAHTRTLREGVTNVIRVIEPKKNLILQLTLMTVGNGVRKPKPMRSWFYYTPFLRSMPRIAKVKYLVHETVQGNTVLLMGSGHDVPDTILDYVKNDVTVDGGVDKSLRVASRIVGY